jgi:hypothetical protein
MVEMSFVYRMKDSGDGLRGIIFAFVGEICDDIANSQVERFSRAVFLKKKKSQQRNSLMVRI